MEISMPEKGGRAEGVDKEKETEESNDSKESKDVDKFSCGSVETQNFAPLLSPSIPRILWFLLFLWNLSP
jgi:hypothetical protein